MPGVEASFTLLDRIPLSWWLMEGHIHIHVGKDHMWPYCTIGNVLVEVKKGFHNSFNVISKIVRVISQQVWIPQLFAHFWGQQLTSRSMERRAENFKVQVVGNSISESKTAQKIWRTIQLLTESQNTKYVFWLQIKKRVSICYDGLVYDTKRQALRTRHWKSLSAAYKSLNGIDYYHSTHCKQAWDISSMTTEEAFKPQGLAGWSDSGHPHKAAKLLPDTNSWGQQPNLAASNLSEEQLSK